ncbi:MAG: sigma 54-interacting transcriptional regulator [Kofleriaceae bacterium]
MSDQTIDDASSVAAGDTAVAGIVMIACGRKPAHLVLPTTAELGRKITAGGATHEIDDDRMSRDHALVRRERGVWVVTDRESRNGTFVDGDRVTGEVRRRGDVVVRLGHTVFVLLADARGHEVKSYAPAGDRVIGPELERTFTQVAAAAAGDTLLVHGESGSGKELAARLYHDAGPRKAGPFVAVNCATIPEGVAERLLFGARKGAFSGAIDALGHFQMAAGGTLFLDEVAELDAAVQAKLLRVLETREVMPIGATAPTPIALGIVAASHRELRGAVADRTFRDDLYYRLARTTVRLPALRERKVDIARFVQRELGALAAHAKLVEACCTRPWPGNVRELQAAIREAARAAITAQRDLVRVEDLADTAGQPVGGSQADTALEKPSGSPVTLDRQAVEAALATANGVVSVAARALGLHRTQLYRLMERLGIKPTS